MKEYINKMLSNTSITNSAKKELLDSFKNKIIDKMFSNILESPEIIEMQNVIHYIDEKRIELTK